ncbi:MAG: hypothetical protein FJW26_21320 [Acidimicrobiia bacterium]|nr:hypothetical protein [Acidimicrobiia bacterium]
MADGTKLEQVSTLFHANVLQLKDISKTQMSGIPHQSRLAAFEQEITDLRRRRPPTPYRQVLRLLRQKHGVQISLHALYSFVQVRKKWERVHRLAAECAASSVQRPSRVSTPIKPAPTAPDSAKAVPAHPFTAAPQLGNVPLPRQKPGNRTLKSFTPSAEYNLERLTPEQMADWLAELKREQGG